MMKRNFKKVIALALSLVMAIAGVTYTANKVSAGSVEDEWAQNGIIAPEANALEGCGYVAVKFETMDGYSYRIYLDGQEVKWKGDEIVRDVVGPDSKGYAYREPEAQEAPKVLTNSDAKDGVITTEVYTTAVAKHTLKIVATKGGSNVTAERVFFTSKKGLAMGDDMTDKIQMKDMNVSWYYDWGLHRLTSGIDEGVSFTPMMWGIGEDNIEEMNGYTSDSNYFLGFNEPDIRSQANIFFATAIDAWNEYIKPLPQRKISPAPAAPGGDSAWLKWFTQGDTVCISPWDGSLARLYDYYDDPSAQESAYFKEGIGNDFDAVVLHYYRNMINLDGLKDACKNLWETYHKPIWITELGLFGMKGTVTDFSFDNDQARANVQEYVEGFVDILDDMPYVERYCWFSYDVDSKNDIDSFDGSGGTAMFEYASGKYTDLGIKYAAIGNPEGYDAHVIPEEGKFKWEERLPKPTKEKATGDETTVVTTTAATATTTASQDTVTTTKADVTTAAPAVKPGKAKIKSAKNVKKKSVKLAWASVAGAKSYQVKYALNKALTKKAKTKTTTKTSFKATGLKKKKTYFFKVRAKNDAGFGDWSAAKKVKIKK